MLDNIYVAFLRGAVKVPSLMHVFVRISAEWVPGTLPAGPGRYRAESTADQLPKVARHCPTPPPGWIVVIRGTVRLTWKCRKFFETTIITPRQSGGSVKFMPSEHVTTPHTSPEGDAFYLKTITLIRLLYHFPADLNVTICLRGGGRLRLLLDILSVPTPHNPTPALQLLRIYQGLLFVFRCFMETVSVRAFAAPHSLQLSHQLLKLLPWKGFVLDALAANETRHLTFFSGLPECDYGRPVR
ncbi:hypothetical protein GEV33_012506 [Tenebrio molitor]|uniref:Uncharacterized protein n=1 Tax=Tenebrio molitor TaxID=7067 RepID=A0A8J6H8Z3_TENMO|nr:hypothetical protein GEV33_012506 [Tenebrio molitor]